jgi:polyisoprenoid-binding protein YceI
MSIETESAIIPAGKWKLVPEDSRVGFSIRRAGINKVTGEFKEFSATVHANDGLVGFAVKAEVKAASFDSGDEDRDRQVKGEELFDVARYPELTFTSTELHQEGDEFTLNGNLTMHGVTKPVTFEVEFKKLTRNNLGQPLAGLTAESVVSRKDFGLTWDSPLDNGLVLSDKATVLLDLLFVDETQI